MQNIAGEDRQQRGRAAKEHREQVERNGAKQDRLPSHIGDALQNPLIGRSGADSALLAPDAQGRHCTQCEHIERKANRVIHHWPQIVKKAAQCRAANHRNPVGRCIPRDRLGQFLESDKKGQEGLHRGLRQAERDAQKGDNAVVRPHRFHAVEGQQEQKRRGEHLHDVARHQHPAPVDAICKIASRQNQKHHRKKNAQPDIAERDWIPRHVIDLPPHRNGLDLRPQRAAEPNAQIEPEITDAGLKFPCGSRMVRGHGQVVGPTGWGWRISGLSAIWVAEGKSL
jgi:hypothetical protein